MKYKFSPCYADPDVDTENVSHIMNTDGVLVATLVLPPNMPLRSLGYNASLFAAAPGMLRKLRTLDRLTEEGAEPWPTIELLRTFIVEGRAQACDPLLRR